MLKKIWHDPVGSNVIAGLIVSVVVGLVTWLAYLLNWLPGWMTRRIAGLWAYLLSPLVFPHWLFILLVFLLIVLGVPTIIAVTTTKRPENATQSLVPLALPLRLSYTTDVFDGLRWRWRYAGEKIDQLFPFCPNCDFQVSPNYPTSSKTRVHFQCESCGENLGVRQGPYNDLRSKVTRLIERNIRAENDQSDRDPLTDVLNRARFNRDAVSFSAQANKAQPLALISLDMDKFKDMNELYGHEYADKVLKQIPRIFQRLIGERGKCYRVGGDEFAVLLPNHSLTEAEALAKRICSEVSGTSFEGWAGITTSAGVGCIPETALECQQMIQGADAALFRAKQDGGSRAYV